jgi:hypothetical protein
MMILFRLLSGIQIHGISTILPYHRGLEITVYRKHHKGLNGGGFLRERWPRRFGEKALI